MTLAKKIKSECYAPDKVRNSGNLRKTSFRRGKCCTCFFFDNTNYVIPTDNDNNKSDTSLLQVVIRIQISDFVSDNDDDSIKDPNYESYSNSSS
ncbi:unnamed protein product [Diabrotica balteata]|uniref:Uncharacterized protein n=1 Tax=Diabrotica balteata TaxID=107213 RepID=A0A9N9SQB1_DIABA|nr:unnamed protein product [Diabrotica balteata]